MIGSRDWKKFAEQTTRSIKMSKEKDSREELF